MSPVVDFDRRERDQKTRGKGEGDTEKLMEQMRKLQEQIQKMEDRLEALTGVPPPITEGKIRTFIDGFDEALDGGIPKGHIVLLSGPTGTMKTSIALSVVFNNWKRGTKGTFISLEEGRESLRRTVERLGMDLQYDFVVDIAKLRMEHEAAEESRDWLDILMHYLQRKMEEEKFDILVIDPLNSLYSLVELANPRKELFHFFSFLRSLGLTSLLVYEAEGDEVTYPYHEDFLADGSLTLNYEEVADGRVELWLRCVKMRHCNHSRDYYRLDYRGERFTARPVSAQ